MSVRMKLTKSKRNNRRSKHGLSTPAFVQEGDVARKSHRVSRINGMYKGREILKPKKVVEAKVEEKTTNEVTEMGEDAKS